MEYKVMNRYELRNYIFNLWNSLGMFDGDERDEEEILEEIYDNLESKEGIDTEIDYVRQELEKWDQDSLQYEGLDKLWNYLNWYKTSFEKSEKIIDLLYKWVGDNYGSQEETDPSYDLVGLGMYLGKELENE
jgi:hypothetical protein